MKLTLAPVLATAILAVSVSAQQTLPECAADCQTLYPSACNATDVDCICGEDARLAKVSGCILQECTIVEALAAQNVSATLCGEPVRDRSLVSPIATGITTFLAALFVAARLFLCLATKGIQPADISAFVAFASSIPMDVSEFFMMHYGFGHDIWTLSQTQITGVVKWTWISQVAYLPAIAMTKVAILQWFLTLFPNATFRKVVLGTIVHCILFMVSSFIATLLACVPMSYIWTNWTGMTKGYCYDNNAFWWAHSAINIATDLWVLGLPMPILFKLQLGTRKKIYLVLMFSIGIIITVVSIIRFSGLLQYSTTTNPTYNNVMVATYSVIECNVSIMCCCMPSALGVLRRLFPRQFGSSYPANSNTGGTPMPKSDPAAKPRFDDEIELVDGR